MIDRIAVWRQAQGKRERFMRDPVPIRLGNLASTVARLATAAPQPAHRELVFQLLTEAEYFVECAGPDARPELQPQLVDMQRQLARWRARWERVEDSQTAAEIASVGRQFSQQLLEWSGLLE